MSLTELYDSKSSCVVAFINKIKKLPAGHAPLFPDIFGTGFLATSDGLVLTNRHVVDVIEQLGSHPGTGEFAGAALLMFVDPDHKGCQVLNVQIAASSALGTFSSSAEWYGQNVPDIGFVQLRVSDTPFLELATEDFAIQPGMEISTIGFPMGEVPLILHGKVGQISPFIRRGIVSSVYPFPVANPHGFTIDIMQPGGSSGSPIFGSDQRVVGMMWGGIEEPRFAQSGSASLQYTFPTNISLAEPAHIIAGALKEFLKGRPAIKGDIRTLQQLRDADPMPGEFTGLTWDTWPIT